jgi:O-antigen biosynthesis protein
MSSTPSQLKNYPLVPVGSETDLEENTSLKKQLTLVGTNKRVVDFGCATGYFAQFLKQRGCYVVGVELNPEAAKVADYHCDQVVVADLDFTSLLEVLPDQKFEVAVFGDVLEHLRNPWQVLEATRQLLQPGGYVVASIPNIAHGAVRLALLQGRFDYAELGLLDNTHLRFFTRKTVQELFEQAGYAVEFVDRTIVPLSSGSPFVPSVDREALSDELLQHVEQAEDADTLQFIVRAFPLSPEGKYAALELKHLQVVEQKVQLQSEVFKLQEELGSLKGAFGSLKGELGSLQAQLQQTQTLLEQSQGQFQQAQKRTIAMESSKFWKIRTVWVRCKQMLGLEV